MFATIGDLRFRDQSQKGLPHYQWRDFHIPACWWVRCCGFGVA